MASSPPEKDILQIQEVYTAPMPPEHKELVITHLKRLHEIVRRSSEKGFIAQSKEESTAEERLDRMTKMFRSYQEQQRRGEFEDDEVESMAAALLETCVLSYLTSTSWEPEYPRGRSNVSRAVDTMKVASQSEELVPNTKVLAGPTGTAASDEREYWIEYFSRPRTQSEGRSARGSAMPSTDHDRSESTRKLAERTPDVAFGRWPLSPEDEREYYATGATRTKEVPEGTDRMS